MAESRPGERRSIRALEKGDIIILEGIKCVVARECKLVSGRNDTVAVEALESSVESSGGWWNMKDYEAHASNWAAGHKMQFKGMLRILIERDTPTVTFVREADLPIEGKNTKYLFPPISSL